MIELAPVFAPNHVLNVKALAREGYFDGLAIIRAQDNYVVQWGSERRRREEETTDQTGQGDPSRRVRPRRRRSAIHTLPDGDVYAPEVGLSGGFPAARDPKTGRAWLAHCYGMLGADVATMPRAEAGPSYTS